MSNDNDGREPWRRASSDLGIQAVAPFALRVGDRERQYLAWVPQFGGGSGMVVAALPYDAESYTDATSAGYRCSFINADVYGEYDREAFIEMLADWGYTGPANERPIWLKP